VPRGEIVLWVDSWVASTKSLTQWDVLADYSRSSDNLPLAMDCMWRLHEWETLAAMLMQNQGQVRAAMQFAMHVYTCVYGCVLRDFLVPQLRLLDWETPTAMLMQNQGKVRAV
jgi:hypothetical protein